MNVWLPGILNVCLFCYGIFRIKRETEVPDQPAFFIAVQDQEEVVEFILRFLLKKMRRKALPYRLVVLVGDSQDKTGLIVRKMSAQMSFIVREIKNTKDWNDSFLDLRGRRDVKEINVLINRFLALEMWHRQSHCRPWQALH